MPFTLPDLPYKFDALEPFIDSRTMEIHHDKHHAAYVAKLNDAIAKHPELSPAERDPASPEETLEELLQNINKVPEDIRTAVRNHGGGHSNHSLFWAIMKQNGVAVPTGDLAKAINSTFGSFVNFQEKVIANGLAQFGSGWTWLVVKADKTLAAYATANQDSPLMQGDIPILGIDVWEHAYYLKYQNKRDEYLKSWWSVVNWEEVSRRYDRATLSFPRRRESIYIPGQARNDNDMLKINNLFVTIENKEIVKGVSLTIKPGEIHALMGPNGSGKSSLAMAIAGHPAYEVAKEEGRRKKVEGRRKAIIELDGKDITYATPDERARMGLFLAMQYPVGVGGVTVEQLLRRSVQEISKGRTLSDTRIDVLQFRKDLEKLAETVGVNRELLFRSLNVGFSGGEKKRLEILQMLALQPKYAILDETDSGLDIDAMKTIANAIKSFSSSKFQTKTEKPGILVITHYAKLLHYLKPDFVHIMKDGRIVESGGEEVAKKIERNGYKDLNGHNG